MARHEHGLRGERLRSGRELVSAFSLAALGALLLLLFAACGDVKVRLGDECGGDTDCGEGQICIDSVCVDGCRTDADCRARGAGFYCVDEQCSDEGEDDPLLLLLSVGGSLLEGTGDAREAAVDEQSEGIPLDASGSVYIGEGAVTWLWRVAQSPADVVVALGDTDQPRALLSTPQVFEDALVEIELTATYPEGSETVTTRLTIRNSINEPPVVTVTGPPDAVAAGAVVTLEAAATEPNDEDMATPLAWEQTAGSAVTLADASGDGSRWHVRFTAPSPAEDERLTFRVRVRDRHDPPAEGAAEVSVDVLAATGGCTDAADCDDEDPCTTDDCNATTGACSHTPVAGCCESVADCDDGDPCTTDGCDAGSATCSHAPVAGCCGSDGDCDDGDPCTTDGCDAGSATCTHAPVADCCGSDGDCDDADPCTSDTCNTTTGACAHAPVADCCREDADCADEDSCTSDVCNEATGRCAHPALPGCCESDGDCDDGEVCTTDTCDTGSGDCSYAAVAGCCRTAADCGDGEVCTTDSCNAATGECGYADVVGCCRSAADCDDGEVCTGSECDPATGECSFPAIEGCCRSAADCGDDDVCTTDTCATATGECGHAEREGCCRTDEQCADADPCTDDRCNTATGECSHPAAPGCCTGDADCDDDDVCTTDTCDEASGDCSHVFVVGCCRSNADCDDQDVCTADTCATATGACSHAEVADCCRADAECGDGDVCTADLCDEATGVCSNPAVADCCRADADCADEDVCTTDTCDETTGVCSNALVPECCRSADDCLDENPCTEDVCDPPGGTCSNPPIEGCCLADAECDDQDVCTADGCDQQLHVCTHLGVPSCCHSAGECPDDQNPCTYDRCVQNQCVYPALPFGASCVSPDGSLHGAICDSAATCQPFTRDIYPDELLWTADERHYAFWLNDVYRLGETGPAWAVGRQWYYRFAVVRAPIDEERGVVLSLDGGVIRDRALMAPRQGAYTGVHLGLAVGSCGVAHQEDGAWSDVTTALQLSATDYAGAQDVWGGATSIFCCPRAWVVARANLGPLRIDLDLSGGWSVSGLFYDPAARPPRARVWGFSYDPNPFDTALDLQMLDTYLLLDEGDARSVRWAQRPDPDLGLKPEPPGCDPATGDACSRAAPWRDAFGLREGLDNVVWGVGDAGTVQYRSDAQGGWKAIELPPAALEGYAPEDIDWYGVAILREHVFLVGIAHGCGGICPISVDDAAAVVLLHLDRDGERPAGLVVLDRYACSNLGLGGLRLCQSFPVSSLRVGDVWVSESDDGLLDVWVVGGWPQFDGDLPQDVRAALWHVRLAP